MKILRDRQVEELTSILHESKRLLDESQRLLNESQEALDEKNALLHSAVKRIAELQDALLTEKRCHATVAAAASEAISSGVDLREELDQIAAAVRADVARLEEWFVSDNE